MKEQNT